MYFASVELAKRNQPYGSKAGSWRAGIWCRNRDSYCVRNMWPVNRIGKNTQLSMRFGSGFVITINQLALERRKRKGKSPWTITVSKTFGMNSCFDGYLLVVCCLSFGLVPLSSFVQGLCQVCVAMVSRVSNWDYRPYLRWYALRLLHSVTWSRNLKGCSVIIRWVSSNVVAIRSPCFTFLHLASQGL